MRPIAKSNIWFWMRGILVGLVGLLVLAQAGSAAIGLTAAPVEAPGIHASTWKPDCNTSDGGESSPSHRASNCLECCICCNSRSGPSPLVQIPEQIFYFSALQADAFALNRRHFDGPIKGHSGWILTSWSPRAPPVAVRSPRNAFPNPSVSQMGSSRAATREIRHDPQDAVWQRVHARADHPDFQRLRSAESSPRSTSASRSR